VDQRAYGCKNVEEGKRSNLPIVETWHGHAEDNVRSSVVLVVDVERKTQECILRCRAEGSWEGTCPDYIDPSGTTLVHLNWGVPEERGRLVSWHSCRTVDRVYLCPKHGTTRSLALVLIEQKCGSRVRVGEGSYCYVLSEEIVHCSPMSELQTVWNYKALGEKSPFGREGNMPEW
jgi:hypothetical protein